MAQDMTRLGGVSAGPGAGDDRLAIVAGYPPFAVLPPYGHAAVAARLSPAQYPVGATVIAEGEAGDRLYLIAAGRAEVVARTADGRDLLLAVLGPGEGFGEMALITGAPRSATVRALTPLNTYALSATDFANLIASYPALREATRDLVAELQRANFLKRATPFSCLDAGQLRQIAGRLQPREVPAGTVLMRQGEPGDWCAIVRRGRLQVLVRTTDGVEAEKASLGPGASVGEMALLTGAPRSATVVAVEPTELWTIDRVAFEAALAASEALGAQFRSLLGTRSRPSRRPGVEIGERQTDAGEPVYVLRDLARWVHLQVSEEGRAVWDLLDGTRTLAEVAAAVDRRFGGPSTTRVVRLVDRLAAAGLVEMARPLATYGRRPLLWRLLRLTRRLLPPAARPPGIPDGAFCTVADVELYDGHPLRPAHARVLLAARDGRAAAYQVDVPLTDELDLALGDQVELWYFKALDRQRARWLPDRLVNRRSGQTFTPQRLRSDE